jgi:hypothetical protein
MDDLRQQLAEAEARAATLLDGIQGIEVQLSAPSRYDPQTGQPMTEDVYAQWRYRANHAKAKKLSEYRQLKPEIYRLREAIHAAERTPRPMLTARQVEVLNRVWAELAARDALPLSLEAEIALALTDDEVDWLAQLTSTALERYTGGFANDHS